MMLAKVSNVGFKQLISLVQPTLFNIARSMCSRRAEDLLQAGIIKIWRSLDNVDLGRPDTIRKVVTSIGVYGMQDELRAAIRRNRLEVAVVDESMVAPVLDREAGTPVFTGLLAEYVKYIDETGSFVGAHRYMADTKGIKIHLARKRFHQAVKEFLKGNGNSSA
jgi:DNA-directed RNA polymerase specialized sigma24 family protein